MFSISLIDVWWLLMSGIVQITEAVATTAHIQCFFLIIIIALLKKKSNHVVSICRWKLRAEKIDWMCVCAVCAGLSLDSLILSLCAFFFLICIHFFWSLCCFSVGLANQLDELFNWILLCVRPSDWTLWNETLSIVANCSRTIRFDERFFFYLFCLNIFICSRWRIDECREDISAGDMSSDIDEVFNFRKSIKYMVIGHSFTPTYVRNGSCQQYGQWAGWPFRNCASFCKCVSVWECHSSPFRLCRQDAWA